MGRMFGRKSAVRERDGRPPVTNGETMRNSRAYTLSVQGKDFFATGQYAAAIPVLGEAIEDLRRFPVYGVNGRNTLLGVDLCYLAVCLHETESMREALAAAEESIPILEPGAESDWFVLHSLTVIALCLHGLAERPEDKLAAARRALEVAAREGDSVAAWDGMNRVRLRKIIVNALIDSDELRAALSVQREAIGVFESLVESAEAARYRGLPEYSTLAALHAIHGEFAEACAAVDTCAVILSEPDFSLSPESWQAIARNLSRVGRQLAENERPAQAGACFALAIDAFRRLRTEGAELFAPTSYANCLNDHAWHLCGSGDPEAAVPFAHEAVDLIRSPAEATPAGRRLYGGCLDTLATALAMSGRTDEALAACRESIAVWRESVEAEPEVQRLLASGETLLARILGEAAGSFTER